MRRATLAAAVSLSTVQSTVPPQPRESASCQSDIVSSTVVATFCGHRQGDKEVLDLLILWRGRPGWFRWTGTGRRGSAGSAGGNVVSQSQYFGEVTIAYKANFDTNVATIGESTIKLDRVNTVVVDDVDTEWRVTATRWTDPALPLVADRNLLLARRSPELVRDLQCGTPMPALPPMMEAVTVCEKLKNR